MGEQATRVITGQARRKRFLTVAAAAAVVVIAVAYALIGVGYLHLGGRVTEPAVRTTA